MEDDKKKRDAMLAELSDLLGLDSGLTHAMKVGHEETPLDEIQILLDAARANNARIEEALGRSPIKRFW